MTGTPLASTSRRIFLARVLLAVVATRTLGSGLGGSAGATKKGKNTIASIDKRISNQRDTCELINGGTLSVTTLPSGTRTTFCSGGKSDGTYCKNTESETSCRCNNTGKDGECSQAVNAPGQSDSTSSPDDAYPGVARSSNRTTRRHSKRKRNARKRRQ